MIVKLGNRIYMPSPGHVYANALEEAYSSCTRNVLYVLSHGSNSLSSLTQVAFFPYSFLSLVVRPPNSRRLFLRQETRAHGLALDIF